MDIVQGRYFTRNEVVNGDNKVILGHTIASELFGTINPLTKDVKLFGQKFQVVGVLKEEGDNPFNLFNYDEATWISYKTASKFLELDNSTRMDMGKIIYVKADESSDVETLKGEITSVLRSERRLKPKEEDNFSLNEISMLDSVFGVLYVAGGFIGFFALLVGMISVANIMFVSVKERTNIIGIKKALGAKKKIILLEFLIESVILCLIGGTLGLILVSLVLKRVSSFIPFEISATATFMLIGVGTSIIVGIVAGFIPAWQASRLDPVEAIRQ
jgi:putative ABC transport system permease protein